MVLWLTVLFFLIELAGGYWAGSIAVIGNSTLWASDIMGFATSLIANHLEHKGENGHMTYGWRRAEVIGTMANVLATWIMSFWLVVAATICFFEDKHVQGGRMLIVSVISLALFFIQMLVLQSGTMQNQLDLSDQPDLSPV